MKLVLLKQGSGEDVCGRQTIGLLGGVVEQVNSMGNSHGPKLWISDVGPVNGRVKHHCPSDSDDCLDRTLGQAVLVVCSRTSIVNGLAKLCKVLAELGGGEGLPIV